MTRTYLCAGGPLHGQWRAIPGDYGLSMLVMTRGDVFFKPASATGALVPVEQAVYKLEAMRYEHDGLMLSVTMLVYYGRGEQDRPSGFSL